MRMRDGSKVDNQRLGRLRQWDDQNYQFALRAADRPPRSYTWRLRHILDQGRPEPGLPANAVDSCVGFSLAHNWIARPGEQDRPDLELVAPFLARAVYWRAQQIDPWEETHTAGEGGTSVLAGIKAAQAAGWVGSYWWPMTVGDVLDALSYRSPVVMGTWWWSSMFEPQGGFLVPSGSRAGGHAYLLTSINVSDRTVTVANSWGPNWGDNGRALLKWDHLDQLLNDQGEAVVPLAPGVVR